SKELPELNPRKLLAKSERKNSFPTETGYTVKTNEIIRKPVPPQRNIIGFHDGPDVRLVPADEIGRALKSIMSRTVNLKYMSYVETAGVEKFRKVLSDYLNSSRGLQTTSENITITRGSQMGLYLICNALFKKDEII